MWCCVELALCTSMLQLSQGILKEPGCRDGRRGIDRSYRPPGHKPRARRTARPNAQYTRERPPGGERGGLGGYVAFGRRCDLNAGTTPKGEVDEAKSAVDGAAQARGPHCFMAVSLGPRACRNAADRVKLIAPSSSHPHPHPPPFPRDPRAPSPRSSPAVSRDRTR